MHDKVSSLVQLTHLELLSRVSRTAWAAYWASGHFHTRASTVLTVGCSLSRYAKYAKEDLTDSGQHTRWAIDG